VCGSGVTRAGAGWLPFHVSVCGRSFAKSDFTKKASLSHDNRRVADEVGQLANAHWHVANHWFVHTNAVYLDWTALVDIDLFVAIGEKRFCRGVDVLKQEILLSAGNHEPDSPCDWHCLE